VNVGTVYLQTWIGDKTKNEGAVLLPEGFPHRALHKRDHSRSENGKYQ
jgi:hypothetical protein